MLRVENATFGYTADNPVIKKLNFQVAKGTHLSVIGSSGCGKSTLLKLISGWYDLDKGRIFWKEQPILGPSFHLTPYKSFIKYLTQDFELMPFITVAENVGRFLSNFYLDRKRQRIEELLEMIEMTSYTQVEARYLSGGQKQRVALAMTLAQEPELLLLDEPFTHVDSSQKNTLQRSLFSYLKKKQITCIVATHEGIDALSFSDKILVIKSGELLTLQESKFLYDNPPDLYTASLFGDVTVFKEGGKKNFYYPHQVLISTKSYTKAKVKACYFQGGKYLVVLQEGDKKIFAYHSKMLSKGEQVGYFLAKS